jgi:TPR repeat protein
MRGTRTIPLLAWAASAAAMLLALFASQLLLGGAGTSFSTKLLVSSAAAQSDRGNQVQMQIAMVSPSREQISNAYLSALQRTPSVAAPVATPAAPPAAALPPAARRIGADEITLLMKRAISLLASGDIPPARLLLERAADAQEASAAFLLAQTYDPEVLGTSDIRTIAPDRAEALTWYRKAAELGNLDARRRLPEIQK